eukprot:TRINITY_DN45755_c0_g1_i1.p1 TRINITY_DN45755_c0_g1~~TRINITY_DN45755_c0_g1_i1.p1  ORF type:complete len:384 (-),score=64.56 TRINITY_DN45755_c0_g1_i1:231-1382(-)
MIGSACRMSVAEYRRHFAQQAEVSGPKYSRHAGTGRSGVKLPSRQAADSHRCNIEEGDDCGDDNEAAESCDEKDTCCICLRQTRDKTPCNHALCDYCNTRLRQEFPRANCPICRRRLPQLQTEVVNTSMPFRVNSGTIAAALDSNLLLFLKIQNAQLPDLPNLVRSALVRQPTLDIELRSAVRERCEEITLHLGVRGLDKHAGSLRELHRQGMFEQHVDDGGSGMQRYCSCVETSLQRAMADRSHVPGRSLQAIRPVAVVFAKLRDQGLVAPRGPAWQLLVERVEQSLKELSPSVASLQGAAASLGALVALRVMDVDVAEEALRNKMQAARLSAGHRSALDRGNKFHQLELRLTCILHRALEPDAPVSYSSTVSSPSSDLLGA